MQPGFIGIRFVSTFHATALKMVRALNVTAALFLRNSLTKKDAEN